MFYTVIKNISITNYSIFPRTFPYEANRFEKLKKVVMKIGQQKVDNILKHIGNEAFLQCCGTKIAKFWKICKFYVLFYRKLLLFYAKYIVIIVPTPGCDIGLGQILARKQDCEVAKQAFDTTTSGGLLSFCLDFEGTPFYFSSYFDNGYSGKS